MAEITLNNIDKSNWKLFPFEKIAKRIAETVDPSKTELEVYIGLEHLDAETVHIRRHGSPSDVSGGKLKCYPRDIIFGKRRAYQRKAGIVTQDAICSAHSFVFRANEDIIDARLFPFFLHSDQFMHRMVDISVGGLSPTINWSDLRHQEFLLPPKEQQAELADLLWATDDMIEKDLKVLENVRKLKSAQIIVLGNSGELVDLSRIITDSFTGGTPDTKNESFYKNGTIEWITTKEILSNYTYKGEKLIAEEAIKQSNSKILPADNLIVGIRVGVGKFSINKIDISFSQDVLGLLINKKKANLDYLINILNSEIFQKNIEKYLRGTTIKGILKDDILSIQFRLPSIEIQNSLIEILNNLNYGISNLEFKIQSSQSLQRALINQIF